MTDQQIADARKIYEAGQMSLREIATQLRVRYLKLWHIARKDSWLQPSDVPEISHARELCARQLHRRAITYLSGLVRGESQQRDDAIIAELARINATLQARSAEAARTAAHADKLSRYRITIGVNRVPARAAVRE